MKRWSLKILIFALFMVLLHAGTLHPEVLQTVRAMSPLLFLANCFTGTAALFGTAALTAGTLTLLLSLWKRRFFCRWICPLGFLQDVLRALRTGILRSLKRKAPTASPVNSVPHTDSASPTESVPDANSASPTESAPSTDSVPGEVPPPSTVSKPSGRRPFSRFFLAGGSILALASLGALGLGGFSFLFLDPLVLLDAGHHTRWGICVLAGIGLSIFFWPRLWCFFLCPCGGMQEILWGTAHFFRKTTPEKAVQENSLNEKRPMNSKRRRFLKAAGILALGGTLTYALKTAVQKTVSAASGVLVRFRPPGAAEEKAFLSRCTRCGACANACPTRLIQLENDLAKPLTFSTPTLNFEVKNLEERLFCAEDCTRCAEVCPTGAIRKFTLPEKKELKLARCTFEYELCRRYYQMECSICLQTCPYEALEEVWSDEAYAKIPSVNPDLCTGCGKCAAFCPGEPLIRWDAESGGFPQDFGSSIPEQTEAAQDSIETTGHKALKIVPLASLKEPENAETQEN